MNLLAIANELAQLVATAGVNTYPVLPDAADYPCAVIHPPTNIQYSVTMGGGNIIDIAVSVYAKSIDLPSAWTLLYQLMSYEVGGTSIINALVNNPSAESFSGVIIDYADGFKPLGDNSVTADLHLQLISTNLPI